MDHAANLCQITQNTVLNHDYLPGMSRVGALGRPMPVPIDLLPLSWKIHIFKAWTASE